MTIKPWRWLVALGLALAGTCGAGELANADFSDFDGGLPKGWREMTKAVECTPLGNGGGVAFKVTKENRNDASLEQTVSGIPANTPATFSAEVAAGKPGIAYLQVKLYKAGKEILRRDSNKNGAAGGRLQVVVDTGEADRLSVHCRMHCKANLVGVTATFSGASLTFGGAAAAPAVTAAAAVTASEAPAAAPAKGVPAVEGWRNQNVKEQAMEAVEGGFRLQLLGASRWDGSVGKDVKDVAADTGMTFSGTVAASRAGIAYLQVKLFKGGKEIKRFDSKRNAGVAADKLSVSFDTGDADKLQLLARTTLSDKTAGGTATFTGLELVP